MCAFVCIYMHFCADDNFWRPEIARSPRAGVIGNYGPPDMGPGTQILVVCNGSMCYFLTIEPPLQPQ